MNYAVTITEGACGTYHCEGIAIPDFEPTNWPHSTACRIIENRKHNYFSRTYKPAQIDFLDENEMYDALPEHSKIMTPAPELGEGIFAVTQHLGEGRKPVVMHVNGEAHMEGGHGLTQLEKIIYNEAVVTGQGAPCLPHEDRSKRPWYKYAGGIKQKFACTTEQAETLCEAFRILDANSGVISKKQPRQRRKLNVSYDEFGKQIRTWTYTGKSVTPPSFESWLLTNLDKGVRWFENMAIQLVLVTDEGAPVLDLISYDEINHEQKDDTPEPTIFAEKYHKLDDPRDDEPTWESRQPKKFQYLLKQIRVANLAQLKTIGKSLFNDKSYTPTQATVIWDEYHRRKANVSPRLSRKALRALERLIDPAVDLSKVANWLYHEGLKELTKYDQEVVWSAWRARKPEKKVSAPVQNFELPLDIYDEGDFAENYYE